jgi:hypothetical protein
MEAAMVAVLHKSAVDTERFQFLNPTPPFVEVCLRPANISHRDFQSIANLAASYRNDARLVLMVKKAGDASAKVTYLLNPHETPKSILETLREIAAPYVEQRRNLPEELRSTIDLLLSINAVPYGCEAYTVTALLTLDAWQEGIVKQLRELMIGRQMAKEVYADNLAALAKLDHDWPRLRVERDSTWHKFPLPETSKMQYHPLFDEGGHIVSMHESCVIVDPPDAQLLKSLTPRVLQRPLPDAEGVPTTGSADWLLRDIGKIGRHFTRALLSIIKDHLRDEEVALEARNYLAIHRQAMEAVREYTNRMP